VKPPGDRAGKAGEPAPGEPALGGPDGRAGGASGDPGNASRRQDRRSPLFLAVAGTVAVLFFVLFVALGTWQVERRTWKLDLIARVEQRVHAPPAIAPGPAQWPNISAAADEYRRVTATGTFLDDSQTLVQAVTDLGAGYWVLTPLRLSDGSIVLVNRGFVPADDRDRVQPGGSPSPALTPPSAENMRPDATSALAVTAPSTAAAPSASATHPDLLSPAAAARITGLLRMTEPRGAFLRHNDPAGNRWYSRDVQAIAAARGLTHVAPYFIDAEAAPGDANAPRAASDTAGASPSASADQRGATTSTTAPGARMPASPTPNGPRPPTADEPAVTPVPGLTVITFHNSHLVYAITWYTLALMVAIAIWLGIRKR
jgi:surfeit locus 1 family protein